MKDRPLGEKEYRAFKKTHPHPFALEIEADKIQREKETFAHYSGRGARLFRHRLRRMTRADMDEEALESELEIERCARRVLRNAHRHKHRLRGLEHIEEQPLPTRQGD